MPATDITRMRLIAKGCTPEYADNIVAQLNMLDPNKDWDGMPRITLGEKQTVELNSDGDGDATQAFVDKVKGPKLVH